MQTPGKLTKCQPYTEFSGIILHDSEIRDNEMMKNRKKNVWVLVLGSHSIYRESKRVGDFLKKIST